MTYHDNAPMYRPNWRDRRDMAARKARKAAVSAADDTEAPGQPGRDERGSGGRTEALAQVLAEHGIHPNGEGGPHGWRCTHPDRFPDYCTCIPDLVADLNAACEVTDARP